MSIQSNPVLPESSNLSTLSLKEQKARIAEAIKQQHSRINFDSWGNEELFNLLNYKEPEDDPEGAGINTYTQFLSDLLLLLARPEINQVFHEEIGSFGLQLIKNLSEFFSHLNGHLGYEEWVDYRIMKSFIELSDRDISYYAEKYLPASDLVKAQLAAEEVIEWPKMVYPSVEGCEFRTDEDLIAALDREFPGVNWPADKLTVAKEPRMLYRLKSMELERIKRSNETPEERKAREIKEAIDFHLNWSPANAAQALPVKTQVKKPATSKPEHAPNKAAATAGK